MKDKQIQVGDSIVATQDKIFFSGVVARSPTDTTLPKGVYPVVVTNVYPDIQTGRKSDKIQIGQKVPVSVSQIRSCQSEAIDGINPDFCVTVQNGMIVLIRRTDGNEDDVVIKVIDEDDGTVKMFKTNIHTFSHICNTINEDPALI